MPDLIVIGAGLSGLSAALTAAQAGLNVKVIAKGLGAQHWSAATIDLLGYLPGPQGTRVERPLETIGELGPTHPYRLVDSAAPAKTLARFQQMTADAGLPYAGANIQGENLWLPSPAGVARPAYLAPLAQVGGDLSTGEPILVVGFDGMRDFFPTLIAENLGKQGYDARATFLPLDVLTNRHDSNTIQLAAAVARPPVHNRLGIALSKLAKRGERIGLPAILGLDSHAEVMATLAERAGAVVFEIPTLPPSVPGVRLHTSLRKRLQSLGVRVEAGMEATGYGDDGRYVNWVETETSSRPLRHRAANFLLATGGVLGGGFNSDHNGRFWEVIFDLPLTVAQERQAWFRPEFLDPAGQPVFSGGVAVNRDFQPVNGDGVAVFENVWAAGSLLAHADPIQERSLEGIAIATGVAAAEKIVGAQRR